jgi:beta-glucosidase
MTSESVSSNIDDKTMHELYLWAFMEPIRAGTGNVMCSYNRLNNSHACANSKSLNGLLKTELGFQGFVVSDWYAQHSGYESALAGLDMAMPDEGIFWGANLTKAITNGTVPESRLDDMATRCVWIYFATCLL